MRIGVAGIGRLGTAISKRLLKEGEAIAIWNRTPGGRLDELRSLGATVCATPTGLAQGSDLVLTVLSGEEALREVYLSPEGLLASPVAGKTFVEMSTAGPGIQRELHDAARAAGAAYVECPVGGSVDAALNGALVGFAGGDPDDIDRVRGELGKLCRIVEKVGPIGTAARVKLATNVPIVVYYQVLAEALSLLGDAQLDPHALIRLFTETGGGSNFLRVRGTAIADALSGQPAGEPHSTVSTLRKDLEIMLGEAGALGVPLPIVEAALRAYGNRPPETDAIALPALWLHDVGTSRGRMPSEPGSSSSSSELTTRATPQ